jgi:predicted transcriptional regulator
MLGAARNLDTRDPATRLHVAASLAAELDARLGAMVVDVRRDGCSWAGIADLLGVTRAGAWQRYAGGDLNQHQEGSR